MEKLKVFVRPNQDGWWAEVTDLKGCYSHGDTLDELKVNLKEAVELHLEDDPENKFHGDYYFELTISLEDLFEYYPINVTGLANYAGINRSLLQQYANGRSMGEKQAQKITAAIHKMTKELGELVV